MRQPTYQDVYADLEANWPLVTASRDAEFEGQHFDRKEAGRSDPGGALGKSQWIKVYENVEQTLSAFGNADGGLLVLGVDANGSLIGIDHLSEGQQAALIHMNSLKNCQLSAKTVQLPDAHGIAKKVALFRVEPSKQSICQRVKDGAAWIRKGPSNVRLLEDERERIKLERKVVDFEAIACDSFDLSDVDTGVLSEYRKAIEDADSYDWTDIEVLRHAGAICSQGGEVHWTHAGVLFFSANPQRTLNQAKIRLLRYDVPYSEEDERPTSTFDKLFTGPITKQIRDFRTFVAETGFFKTYQRRKPEGGFSDEPEFPLIAVEEAVVNAVAHRDYAVKLPVQCEKYIDAFVVKSPGRLRQFEPVPSQFLLSEVKLEHLPRNGKIVDWLLKMKDTKGAAYIRAQREGTRRMRDEMKELQLPSPEYDLSDALTRVVLRNDAERREARKTGLGNSSEETQSVEFTNVYPLEGNAERGGASKDKETRRFFLDAFANKLMANGWFIDRKRMGQVIAHRKGEFMPAPHPVTKVVRIFPAYSFSFRSYFGRSYLVIDFTVEVQSVLTLQQCLFHFDAQNLCGLRAFAEYEGKIEPVRLIGFDGTETRVHVFEHRKEAVLQNSKIYPSLPRRLVSPLVVAAASHYDLAREIKMASLSMHQGAAKIRSERVQRLAEEISNSIFPLAINGREITLNVNPLCLLPDGDGKRALRVNEIREPDVEFNRGQSTANIREGITKFGAFGSEPRDIEIVPLCLPGYEQKMRALIERLQTGKFLYKGAERTFSTRLKYRGVTVAQDVSVVEECRRLVGENEEWCGDPNLSRIMLVHTPEANYALDDIKAPYYRAKRFLLEAGIPCQMVDTPTLINPDYKDLNLALNLVAKSGVTPWVLPDSIPDADYFVGLSYTSNPADDGGRLLGFANVFNQYGRWMFYSGGESAVRYDERQLHYAELVRSTLQSLRLPDAPTICFHYSARYSEEDRKAIVRGARMVCPKAKFIFVWINKHHPIRLFDERAETDGSVARGRFVVGSPNQLYLSTTGNNPYRKTLGTAHALEINVHIESAVDDGGGLVDHRAMARQVLSLTKLNWASTDSLCAEPITTKYAGDIAYLTAAFQRQGQGDFKLHPGLAKTPWFI